MEYAYLLNEDTDHPREDAPHLKFQAANYIAHRGGQSFLERFKFLAAQKGHNDIVSFITKAQQSVQQLQKLYEEPDEESKQLALRIGDMNPPCDLTEKEVSDWWDQMKQKWFGTTKEEDIDLTKYDHAFRMKK